ncbi:hypothetical protein IEQ34_026737 [Dendrobium chrysotoxum]|uniref:Uncharacterized protein n=1 Tax=Dendrobium chrysotoxum TaxID=161865 RepID=A0AAV7FLQ8_DENCH|nr:hypothetical protein IEQ34_026737 [Dendrobium chrysotoxum]
MMFAKLFCRCSDDASVAMSPCKLQETSEKLEEKEFLLQGKVAVEIERAKEFAKAKNREGANQIRYLSLSNVKSLVV